MRTMNGITATELVAAFVVTVYLPVVFDRLRCYSISLLYLIDFYVSAKTSLSHEKTGAWFFYGILFSP